MLFEGCQCGIAAVGVQADRGFLRQGEQRGGYAYVLECGEPLERATLVPFSFPYQLRVNVYFYPSPRWQRETLLLALPARLLAPKRSNDDIQQRTYPRPRQRRYPRLQTYGMAVPARGFEDVRMGRRPGQVLFAWAPNRLVGKLGRVDTWCALGGSVYIEGAEEVC